MYTYDKLTNDVDKKTVLPLIRHVYAEQGYMDKDAEESSFSKFILSPLTSVFVGKVNDILFATVSVVPDGPEGLPMDLLFKDELQIFRSKGEKLVEVTQFAVDHEIVKAQDKDITQIKLSGTSVPLLKMIFNFAHENNVDKLCIAVNPKHDVFYKSLGFEELGELKYYPSVNNAPALARVLDMKKLDINSLPGILR